MWSLALIRKEFWQLLPLQIVGLGLMMLYVFSLCGFQPLNLSVAYPTDIPFFNYTTANTIPILGGCLAILLGFWQTLSESYRGTWLFLWHRPVSRMHVTMVKLLTGLGILWGILVLPMLVYAWWASIPGNVPAPMLWENTAMYWKSCFGLSMVYLSSFLCGLRQARWHGSRLLPLIVAVAAAFTLLSTEYLYTATLVLIIVIDCLFLAAIHYQLTHEDFS